MDEPTMGLSPRYVERVLELIQAIREQDVTIFVVEQNANLMLQIADYGYVLQTGRIALAGPAGDLLRNPQIRDAYLGGDIAAQTARSRPCRRPVGKSRQLSVISLQY
jgi:branched-chain amino acid transport system ATP-binding protein